MAGPPHDFPLSQGMIFPSRYYRPAPLQIYLSINPLLCSLYISIFSPPLVLLSLYKVAFKYQRTSRGHVSAMSLHLSHRPRYLSLFSPYQRIGGITLPPRCLLHLTTIKSRQGSYQDVASEEPFLSRSSSMSITLSRIIS